MVYTLTTNLPGWQPDNKFEFKRPDGGPGGMKVCLSPAQEARGFFEAIEIKTNAGFEQFKEDFYQQVANSKTLADSFTPEGAKNTEHSREEPINYISGVKKTMELSAINFNSFLELWK